MLVKHKPEMAQAFKWDGTAKMHENGVAYYDAFCAKRQVMPLYNIERDPVSGSLSIESFVKTLICPVGHYLILHDNCVVEVMHPDNFMKSFEICLLEGLVGDESTDFLSLAE